MAAGTALALVSAGAAVYSALKKPKQETLIAPGPLPAAPDNKEEEKAQSAAIARRRRGAGVAGAAPSGRAATLLTGPSGATTSAITERKTLLGM